ncbi:BTAD domain-containing putative transcriptional regulator [Streptomyces sp. NPDC050617]|uniref:AfsR/SARP family transcriptional regulator n=1 Tax=Streptomyces sp. NPDC050617 TaxID=3154628 RepID=UPI0034288607
MEFRVLGPLSVALDGVEIPLDGEKQRTMLAALLLARGRMMPDSRLSTLLWGLRPPATVTSQIYTYISRLRKRLGPGVELRRRHPGYVLDTRTARFDLTEFEQRAALGHGDLAAGQYESAAARLRSALDLWHGPALSNVAEFLESAELPALEEARMSALEGRIEADLELGRHARLVPELTRLVADFPLREQLRAQLMSALYRCARQADALAVHQEGRRLLREELGIDPGPVLRETYQSILTGGLAPVPPRRPGPRGPVTVGERAPAVPAMLPAAAPDFTGRDEHLADIVSVLRPAAGGAPRRHQRIVVTGMPGAGKSALAVRAGALSRAAFPGGQLYADLAAERGPADVLAAFLRALGHAPGDIPAALTERTRLYRAALAERSALVVLDNLDGAAADAYLRALLPGAGPCRAVITSRGPLTALEGTHVVRLGPFAAAEALGLLAAVAGAERVAREPEAALRIVESCGLLPLAVRVCGGRLLAQPHRRLDAFADRLADPARRLDELRLGGLDVRAALRSAWRGLGAEARRACAAVAALGTPDISAPAVAALLGTSPDEAEQALGAVVESRLLDVGSVDGDGRLRYRVHPLVQLSLLEQSRAQSSARPSARLSARPPLGEAVAA